MARLSQQAAVGHSRLRVFLDVCDDVSDQMVCHSTRGYPPVCVHQVCLSTVCFGGRASAPGDLVRACRAQKGISCYQSLALDCVSVHGYIRIRTCHY